MTKQSRISNWLRFGLLRLAGNDWSLIFFEFTRNRSGLYFFREGWQKGESGALSKHQKSGISGETVDSTGTFRNGIFNLLTTVVNGPPFPDDPENYRCTPRNSRHPGHRVFAPVEQPSLSGRLQNASKPGSA